MFDILRAGFVRLMAIGLMSAGAVSYAAAQESISRLDGLALSGDQPIQIESDKLEVQDEEGKATFSGNVKVVQGNTMMQSGYMVVYYAKDGGSAVTGTSEIDRIDVRDRVYIRTENQEATADRGTFDMRTETVELTGDRVVLSQGDNVLVGCKLTVLMQSSEARVEKCPGERVRMQFSPSSGN